MTDNVTVKTGRGGGWLILIFIILFVLKLNPGGHLDSPVEDWSWWWVTVPIWGPFALIVLFLVLFGIGSLVVQLIDKRRAAKRRKAAWDRIHKRAGSTGSK